MVQTLNINICFTRNTKKNRCGRYMCTGGASTHPPVAQKQMLDLNRVVVSV